MYVLIVRSSQGNAEKSRIIMVGDTLKRAGEASEDGRLVAIKDLAETQYDYPALADCSASALHLSRHV